jgi:hypothetical protein
MLQMMEHLLANQERTEARMNLHREEMKMAMKSAKPKSGPSRGNGSLARQIKSVGKRDDGLPRSDGLVQNWLRPNQRFRRLAWRKWKPQWMISKKVWTIYMYKTNKLCGTENCSRGLQLCSHLTVSQHFREPEGS